MAACCWSSADIRPWPASGPFPEGSWNWEKPSAKPRSVKPAKKPASPLRPPSCWVCMTACCATTPAAPSITSCSLIFSRSEEHTSELQSHHDLVCRLLLEKKKKQYKKNKIVV